MIGKEYSMKANPFTLQFGIEPNQFINRLSPTEKILDTFRAELPATRLFLISGIRGSGKTVLLQTISEELGKSNEWVTVDVSPDMDILKAIAAKLYSRPELKKMFVKAKLDFSAFGLGVKMEGATEFFDLPFALERMIDELARKGLRLLITLDEVVSNNHVKEFAGTFQILMRKKLPVFLLMTGLYENIRQLQNEKTLTFLYRAPMEILSPLNQNAIRRSYAATFQMSSEEAAKLAALTKGYAYAYQVLGYLYWKYNVEEGRSFTPEQLLPDYDAYLEEYSYEKIWFELPATEKQIIAYLILSGKLSVSELREKTSLKTYEFSVYRDRLKKKGIVDVSEYGFLSLNLPRFEEILHMRASEYLEQ